MVGGGNVEVIT